MIHISVVHRNHVSKRVYELSGISEYYIIADVVNRSKELHVNFTSSSSRKKGNTKVVRNNSVPQQHNCLREKDLLSPTFDETSST